MSPITLERESPEANRKKASRQQNRIPQRTRRLPHRNLKSPVTRKARYLRASQIYSGLDAAYPDAKCALNFSNPLQLLIATILSAQSTDRTVNTVTPALFKKYKSSKDFARADTE